MVRSKAKSVRQFPAELSGYVGRRSAPRESLRDAPHICPDEEDDVVEVSLNASSVIPRSPVPKFRDRDDEGISGCFDSAQHDGECQTSCGQGLSGYTV